MQEVHTVRVVCLGIDSAHDICLSNMVAVCTVDTTHHVP